MVVATAETLHHDLQGGVRERLGMAVFLKLQSLPRHLEDILIQTQGPNSLFEGTFPDDLLFLPKPHL